MFYKNQGEMFDAAVKITDDHAAKMWLEGQAGIWVAIWNSDGDEDYRRKSDFAKLIRARREIVESLRYLAGYGTDETRAKIEKMFVHNTLLTKG